MTDGHAGVVLVVDDEPLVRMDLVDILITAGFRTREASCAREAIEILEHDADIKVVFTDIQMPGSMDGIALSHVVRHRWPPTLIIICSGARTPTVLDLPCDAAFIAKPFAAKDLRRVLVAVEQSMSIASPQPYCATRQNYQCHELTS